MSNEKLSLKWNDFQNLLQVSFGELRTDNDFTDVTLACEDQSIKAHKVVLSTCSPFFKKLLNTHSHPQPLIYMKGMKASSLTAIIDFLYLGEANIFQEELDSFFALAEELQLRGLVGNSEEKVQKHHTETFDHTERRTVVNPKQTAERSRSNNLFKDDANSLEWTAAMTSEQKPRGNPLIEPATKAKIESMIVKQEGAYNCTNCGYTTRITTHMREHVEKHIEGLEYPCTACNKIMRSSSLFTRP